MNFLDRVIAAISPAAGLARARSRMALDLAQRGYDGAKIDRRFQNLFSGERTADQDVIADLPTLRARKRELRRNNGWVRNAERRIVAKTVGCGIVGTLNVEGSPARKGAAQKRWDKWADGPVEYGGKRNLYALQRLWFDTIVQSGAVIRRTVITRDGVRFATYEPDHLDRTKDRQRAPGLNRITHGLEFNAIGDFLGAWLIVDPEQYRYESEFVPASQLAIGQDLERAGQSLGVPWGSASIQRVYDVTGYEDAHLLRNKLANCFTAAIHGSDSIARDLGDKLSPGAINILGPNEEITFAAPPDPNDLPPYVRHQLAAIAADYGISYESMSGDYSQVNFSSGRMGGIAENQNVKVWRWQMFIPQLLDTAFAEWLKFEPDTATVEWSPERSVIQDPNTEIPNAIRSIRAGLTTLPEWLRQNGEDPAKVMQEIQDSNKELDRLELVLDCDPRKVSNGGQFQVQPQQGGAPNA